MKQERQKGALERRERDLEKWQEFRDENKKENQKVADKKIEIAKEDIKNIKAKLQKQF